MDRTAQLHHYFYIGSAFLEESLEYCVLCGAERTAGYCGRRADCAAVKPESEGNAVFQNHFLFADRCILSCGFSAVDVDSGT